MLVCDQCSKGWFVDFFVPNGYIIGIFNLAFIFMDFMGVF